jgi:hypothetical protein
MAMRRDQCLDAEGCSGAKDRAEIMRICHLVEHENGAARFCNVGDIAGFERVCFDEQALMHGLGPQPRRELLRGHNVQGHVRCGDFRG